MTLEKFFQLWLSGTTCDLRHGVKSIFWQKGDFVVFKHQGHSSYTGRWSRNSWCETYFVLYDITKEVSPHYNNYHIQKWRGRWSKKRQEELERLVEQLEQLKK